MHCLWGVHQNLSKFFVASEALQIITPEPGLSLKAQAARHSIMQIGLFAINVGRQPQTRAQVQPPAVKMQIVTVARSGSVSSIEADNIVVLILHPDSSGKSSTAGVLLGLYVDHEATDFSQEFSPDKPEVVVLALHVFVKHHHLRKAQGQEFHGVQASQLGKDASAKPRLTQEGTIFGSFAQIDSTQKILITCRYHAQFFI